MATFAYRAVDAAGRRSRGRLEASSADGAARDLEGRGLLALELSEAETAATGHTFGLGRRRAVLEFTRAVAALLPAGMPLVRALAAANTGAPERIRPAFEQVRARVERGDELAGALAEFPGLFSPLYVGIVRAGEKSGELAGAFERLSDYLEGQAELRSKLVSMSLYPVLLATVGMGAIFVLVLFVLPRFAELLRASGAALPRATALVFALGDGARAHWQLLLLLPAAVVVWLVWLRTTAAGRRTAAVLLVHLPVVGHWRRQALGAGFARMTGELVAGGAPLLLALGDARDCLSDPLARAETERIRTRVREGSSLHAAIAERALFPEVLPQMVALGEESGRLAPFLLKAAELLERRTARSVERLVALAEPVMIVGFGGVVALVALALLQAIYGVNAGSFR